MYPGVHAASDPAKPAVVMVTSGRVVTYGELDRDSTRIAHVLRERGVAPGDTIAFLMANGERTLSVCWAAQRSGLRYVPLNWHLTAEEVRYIVDDCGAVALLVDEACAALAEEVKRHCPGLAVALSLGVPIDGFENLDELARAWDCVPLQAEVDGSDLVYSSGTTGRPKGGRRPLSGRHPADMPAAALDFYRLFDFSDDMVYLTPGAPLYHAAPLRFAMAVHRFGGTNVVMERFEPGRALDAIERFGVTHSQWVPTMFVRLLRLAPEVRARFDPSGQRVAIHSAAPCAPAIKQAMIDWWGPIVHEYYGASEGGLLTHVSSAEWLRHRGSVGRPVVGRVHIVGDDGREVAPREVASIYSEAGRPVDYLNDPTKTAQAHNGAGWATIGDVGYVDADGYLYLAGRRGDLVISGGVNIYPREVEDVLIQHPLVVDVVVVGAPDDELGEVTKAFVQLTEAALATAELGAELVDFCRPRLAGFKLPRSIEFVDELPRTDSGKMLTRTLARTAGDADASLVRSTGAA